MSRRTEYFHRLFTAVLGRHVSPGEAPVSDDATKLKATLAALRLDLE